MLGIGVMIHMMFGRNAETVASYNEALGKTISALSLGDDDALHFTFTDGSRIKFSDEGQSCCESRYMRTDDDLSAFVGAKLIGAEIKEAPEMADQYGMHEVQFLEVQTDRGVFTMASHNEHNGYYGGFVIVVAKEQA